MLDENLIAELARSRVVSETFRRLTPEKKEAVYRTVLRLYGEYGYDGLPVERICRAVGISKGSFFQYFRSKSHLLEFAILVFDARLESLAAVLLQQEKAALARDRIWHLFRALVTEPLLDGYERVFYLFVGRALRHARVRIEGIDLERHFRGYLMEIIERGVQTGEIRGDIGPETTCALAWSLIRDLTARSYLGEAIPSDSRDQLITFLFDGVKA